MLDLTRNWCCNEERRLCESGGTVHLLVPLIVLLCSRLSHEPSSATVKYLLHKILGGR
jgi:hypothetical protein